MLNCPARLFRSFRGTIFFVTVLFVAPAHAQGLSAPNSVSLQTDSFVQIMSREEINSWYTEHRAFSLHFGQFPELEDTIHACPITSFCTGFLSHETRNHIVLLRTLTLVPAALTASIENFSDKADRDPKNARLTVKDGKVTIVTPSENGISVDIEASRTQLETTLESAETPTDLTVPLVSHVTPAHVSADTLARLGITELIGTATTNFRGSPKNRIYNIQRAIQDFDGIIIDQGATFSFVDYLGEVDGEHGYLPELVIKNNKTEPEFGGGICQVSTTVFRSALQSGLKITERRNHAYPVQYYKPYGLDATVYVPKPDLKFTNNTPGAILLVPEIDGTLLTFSMYGTKDGRTTTIDGPHILESHPDGSMKTVFTHTVTDATGAVIVNDTFWSNYKSPSLFPHPGDEPIYTAKPAGWSAKQWREYKRIHP